MLCGHRPPADLAVDLTGLHLPQSLQMVQVGQSLPHALRETGKGGLAATPFGLRYTPKEADR